MIVVAHQLSDPVVRQDVQDITNNIDAQGIIADNGK
jgi:hypothetical protein